MTMRNRTGVNSPLMGKQKKEFTVYKLPQHVKIKITHTLLVLLLLQKGGNQGACILESCAQGEFLPNICGFTFRHLVSA